MKKIYGLLIPALLLALLEGRWSRAAEITDLKVFSEKDYVRIAVSLDAQANTSVEPKTADNLVFVHFANTGIEKLGRQSFLYEDNPHLESVSFLPLGNGATVARVKARHPFRIRTYEAKYPERFILELSPPDGKAQNGSGVRSSDNGYYLRGLENLRKGSYDAALISLRSAIRSGQNVPESYFQAGLVRYRLGQLDKALINFSRAESSESCGDEARLFQSWIHFHNGNTTKMLENWRKFAANLPEQSRRLKVAASRPEIDYRALEAAVYGVKPAGEAVELPGQNPVPLSGTVQNADSAAFYFQSGLQARDRGDLQEAADNFEKALSFDPDYPQINFQLGVVYKALGRDKLSASYFEKSLGANGSASRREPVEVEGEPGPLDLDGQSVTAPESGPAAAAPGAAMEQSAAAELTAAGKTAPAENPAAESGSAPAEVAQAPKATRQGSSLDALRAMTAEVVKLPNAGLLRGQVKILTIIMGTLFLLTLLGGRLVRRRFGKSETAVPAAAGLPSSSLRQTSLADNAAAPVRPTAAKRLQVEQVLVRELAAKRKVIGSSEPAEVSGLELQLQPVGQRGMYGVDIARRIKNELSRDGQPAVLAEGAPDPVFRNRHDDLQTRLIRQLRSKNWTISDIAQEMSLSREEIKWALAGTPDQAETEEDLSRSGRNTGKNYGQARALAGLITKENQPEARNSIDREVDLELEINV